MFASEMLGKTEALGRLFGVTERSTGKRTCITLRDMEVNVGDSSVSREEPLGAASERRLCPTHRNICARVSGRHVSIQLIFNPHGNLYLFLVICTGQDGTVRESGGRDGMRRDGADRDRAARDVT